MSTFEIGVRKNVEFHKVQYWLVINAKPAAIGGNANNVKITTPPKPNKVSVNFIDGLRWKIFVIFTIAVNILVTINFYFNVCSEYFIALVVVVHLTCIIFWIDFLAAVSQKIIQKTKKIDKETRNTVCLIVEAISLLPVATIYFIVVNNPDPALFWLLRTVTLLRLYRIPQLVSQLATAGRNQSKVSLPAFTFYLCVFVNLYANFWLSQINSQTTVNIYEWNKTNENLFITSVYYSSVTILNIGYGDITPTTHFEMIICICAMIIGFSMTTGVLTGALASDFWNKEKRREIYRHEYESVMVILRNRKIEKRIIDKISDNYMTLWKCRQGFVSTPAVHILPLSLQKEIYFDINFRLLNKSVIFSTQPRAFLRSVSLLMKNKSFVPGDTIKEPYGMSDAMFCVASGVIEILSEENDETPLFSLTTGSVLGEAALFYSMPIRCIIRASTYVELQVLKKISFCRLVLKYPDIYRAMKSEIAYRLNSSRDLEFESDFKDVYTNFNELIRRKATKRIIHELRNRQKKELSNVNTTLESYKSHLLSLYVVTENIPRVKTLPINLIKSRPWILRPNTPVTELWDGFIFVVTLVVAFSYPFLAGFVRTVTPAIHVLLFLTECVYIVDLYIQCTTAIERKDHFTYVTSIKEIIVFRLKSFGFYLDVLATYNLTVYADLVWPNEYDYAYLLLSQNRVLKVWQVPRYFLKLENKLNANLLLIRTFKYFTYLNVSICWAAVIMFLEACPGEICLAKRWFANLELREEQNSDPSPCTAIPAVVSLYWSTITVCGVGYGDITASSIPDCRIVILCIIYGTILIIFGVAQASSTLKLLTRVRIYFQEEVFAVDRFMKEHDIAQDLQRQVRNFFDLQWTYDKGYSLKHTNPITEALPIQQRQILLTELAKSFLTVPIFQQANPDFLRFLAKSSKVRVLPPDEVITDAGSFVREMYILENGYCEILMEGRTRTLISPVTPFGYFEMILGIPVDINIQTLTHVRIVSLDYSAYLRAVTKYPNMKDQIDDVIKKKYREEERNTYGMLTSTSSQTSELDEFLVKKQKTLLSKTFINVYKYQKSLSQHYLEPFRAWGKFRFFQFCFLPFVVSPYSLFLKIWMILRIISVSLMGLLAPIYFSLPNNTKCLANVIYFLDGFAFLDMYLMFHMGYFDNRGLLMFHPAKTVTWYLKGNFVVDLITAFPFNLVIGHLFPRKDDGPSLFYDAPGLIMVLQFYKFFQGCYYLENNILRRTANIKMLKFIPLAVIITNLVTGLLILLECYSLSNAKEGGDEGTIANEYLASLSVFCKNNNASSSVSPESVNPFKTYVTTYYWVVSTMTTCGFGDLRAHDTTTMIIVMFMVVLGIFLYGYMFASITSNTISVHNQIANYRRKVREMSRFMRQKNVPQDLVQRLTLHYEYNWQRTEGATPQKMFPHVHAALRDDIVANMYEETIRLVPAFLGVEKSVVRVLGKHLDETYFLRGEAIVKYNDIQEYIYLIYRGKVKVYDKSGAVITTMGSGGLFGNISHKPYSLSSVEVVATKNVDILRMHCNIFYKALQIFPNTKAFIEYVISTPTDYIEPLANNQEEIVLESNYLDLLRLDVIPYEITSIKAFTSTKHFTPLDPLPSKTYLFCKKSIFIPPSKSPFSFIILPDSFLHRGIGYCVVVLAYLSCCLTVYMFAFQDFSTVLLIVSYILDFMFFTRIALQFCLSYFDKFGDYVVGKNKIRTRYFNSKQIIGFDIASNIPLDVIVAFLPKASMLPILTILRLNRILRLYYVFEFYNGKSKTLMINKIYLELSWIVVCIGLMIHFFSCIWFFVACPMNSFRNESWVTQLSLVNSKKWQLYLVSLYYVVTLTTTTGYGDIPVTSISEMITAVVFMLLSRFGIVLLGGSMTAVINVQSLHLFLYQERIYELKSSFVRQNISEYQVVKMWNYVTSLWVHETGKQIPKFITKAPYTMRCEVMSAMYGNHLSQSYVFSQLDENFLRQLAVYLKRFVYFAGNYIVQQGDIDHTMYFINKGQVSVLTIHPNLMETIHFTLTGGDYFGASQGLVLGRAHHFSYRAETDVEILSLTLSQWQILLKYFPEVGQKIYERIGALPVQVPVTHTPISSDED